MGILVAFGAVTIDILLFTPIMEADQFEGHTLFDVSAFAVVVLGGFSLPLLVLRHRAPTAVCLALATYGALLTVAIGSRPLVAPLVALYTVAASRSRWTALWCLIAALGAQAMSVRYDISSGANSLQAVAGISTAFITLYAAVWAAGRWSANAKARARHLVETRAAMAAEAVAAERLRIARELHDIVAHAVTVMVLQVGGAKRRVRDAPTEVEETLESVLGTGREAMAEMRRLLDVLRTVSDDETGANTTDRLATLPSLTDQAQAAGVIVRVGVSGEVGRLDPSVDLAAFRVVQEALTNITRHAGPGTTADVNLCWAVSSLGVDITDNGAGAPQPETRELSSGYGLAGLEERVKLTGGRLEHGFRPDGGYRVCATLPTARP